MENITKEQRQISKLEIMLDVCKRDKDALRYQLEEAKRKAAQQMRALDLLSEPACCASFVLDGTHHRDCRLAQTASQ